MIISTLFGTLRVTIAPDANAQMGGLPKESQMHPAGTPTEAVPPFAWRSPQFGGQVGESHSLEIPFVFDTLGHGTEPLWRPNPPQQQQLADTMHAACIAFATVASAIGCNTT